MGSQITVGLGKGLYVAMSGGNRVARVRQLMKERLERAKAAGVRHCKHCGCTEGDACWDQVLGTGCAWVAKDECSTCRPDLRKAMLRGDWP